MTTPYNDGARVSAHGRAMSLCERVAATFQRKPNAWINARVLATVGGFAAWRTRISDLRRAPYSMRIDNRVRTSRGYRVSEYKFVPEGE